MVPEPCLRPLCKIPLATALVTGVPSGPGGWHTPGRASPHSWLARPGHAAGHDLAPRCSVSVSCGRSGSSSIFTASGRIGTTDEFGQAPRMSRLPGVGDGEPTCTCKPGSSAGQTGRPWASPAVFVTSPGPRPCPWVWCWAWVTLGVIAALRHQALLSLVKVGGQLLWLLRAWSCDVDSQGPGLYQRPHTCPQPSSQSPSFPE